MIKKKIEENERNFGPKIKMNERRRHSLMLFRSYGNLCAGMARQ